MMRDYFMMALENFKHRKTRSWLTMIGIFIGITAVVAIVSLGQGLGVAIDEQFSELGIDKIFIQPGGGGFGSTGSVILDESDRRVIDDTQGVINTLGMTYQSARVTYKDNELNVLVTGLTIDDGGDLWYDMQKNNIEEGRMLERGDNFKAFVGYDYSQDDKVFERAAELGDSITINGTDFDIIGFQEDFGNSADNQNIYITADAYRRVFGVAIEDKYLYIIAQSGPGLNPSLVAERIEKNLREHRNRDEGDEDFSLQTTEELQGSFNQILLIVNVVIIGIAAISLVIGGIGIMNTMYTAVVERTQEIGIMKAIGARNSDIMLIFLIESGLLGLVGGIIGVIIGLLISKGIEIAGTLIIGTPLLRAWWSWWLIAGALLFSFLVGSLAGTLPARQASKQKPVDSLRYE